MFCSNQPYPCPGKRKGYLSRTVCYSNPAVSQSFQKIGNLMKYHVDIYIKSLGLHWVQAGRNYLLFPLYDGGWIHSTGIGGFQISTINLKTKMQLLQNLPCIVPLCFNVSKILCVLKILFMCVTKSQLRVHRSCFSSINIVYIIMSIKCGVSEFIAHLGCSSGTALQGSSHRTTSRKASLPSKCKFYTLF